jgi:rubrerythrin
LIPNEYECLNCGERFAEEPAEPCCPICFADSVVSSAFAERMSDNWSDDDDAY